MSAEHGLQAPRGDREEDRFNLEVRRVTWRISVTGPFQTCKACAKAGVTEKSPVPQGPEQRGAVPGRCLMW